MNGSKPRACLTDYASFYPRKSATEKEAEALIEKETEGPTEEEKASFTDASRACVDMVALIFCAPKSATPDEINRELKPLWQSLRRLSPEAKMHLMWRQGNVHYKSSAIGILSDMKPEPYTRPNSQNRARRMTLGNEAQGIFIDFGGAPDANENGQFAEYLETLIGDLNDALASVGVKQVKFSAARLARDCLD